MKSKIGSELILFFLLLALLIATTSAQINNTFDTGFKPDINGFSFQNYGNNPQIVDLTPAELKRLFGDQVCRSNTDGKCILSPPAQRWMDQANYAMGYGHCEGMAVLSALMYYNKIRPVQFGGALPDQLALQNELLQREIAYWWVTQVTTPGGVKKVNESPNAVLDTLINAFKEGKKATEWWVLSLYRPDGTGGHTVTPFAVEDMGNGTDNILIYDNNFPKEIKAIAVNKTSNTWSYIVKINPKAPPEVYNGNSSTRNLEVSSISSRMGTQKCQVCDEGNVAAPQKSQDVESGQGYIQVWLDGSAHLLITDAIGRRIGFLDSGEFINEIPKAEAKKFKILDSPPEKEPMYSIPATTTSQHLKVTIDGTRLKNASYQNIMILGPCFDVGAQKIWLSPGEKDEVSLNWSDYCDNVKANYTTANESKHIDLIVGLNSKKADYEFVARDVKVTQSGSVGANLDMNDGKFTFVTDHNSDPGTAQVMMRMVSDQGEQFFANSGMALQENDAININFQNWQAEGDSMPVEVDHNNDGTVDEQVTLNDDTALHDEYYVNPTEPNPPEATPAEVAAPAQEAAPEGEIPIVNPTTGGGGGETPPPQSPNQLIVYLNLP